MEQNFKHQKLCSLKLLSLILSMVVILSALVIPASADATVNEAVRGAAAGVYGVELVYSDKNSGDSMPIYGGTAFFINEKTLLTCAHVVTIAAEDQALVEQTVKARYGSYSISNLEVKVMLSSDISISATVKKSSEMADWAILETKEALSVTPLKLADSDAAQITQRVSSLGYPEAVKDFSKTKNFSKDDITVTNGEISKITSISDVAQIQHSASISNGNSGGPLVNNNGAVLGINAAKIEGENYYYAISINQIKVILDQLTVAYDTEGAASVTTTTTAPLTVEDPVITDEQPAVTDNTPAAVTVDKGELQGLIDDAEDTDTSGFTSDSVSTFNKALRNAKRTAESTSATQVEVESAINDLQDAMDNLEKGGLNTKTLIIIIAAAVVVILIIVIIIVAVSGGKKKTSGGVQMPPVNNMQPPAGPAIQPMNNTPVQTPSAPYGTMPTNNPPTQISNVGETTVLNGMMGGAGETTVLNGNMGAMFILNRRSSGESIPINKPSFVIGKDNRQCDYCINNNTSISRAHARLSVKGSQCFIADMRSTNGTFVNGSRISPNQELQLKPGDVIRLADEEFDLKG